MSKFLALVFAVLAVTSACDVRSETAKREMEKFTSSPTPYFSPIPTPTPVDPADSVTIDTSQDGETIHINGYKEKLSRNCQKFNRVLINGDDNEVTIKGVCRQIMVNGDRNKITSDAAMEFVFNGSENTLKHSRFVNSKPPVIVENRAGNQIEKVTAANPPAKNKSK